MNIKVFIIGVLLCILLVGGFWLVINITQKNDVILTQNNDAELFANKERCMVYTSKRQVEAKEKERLLGHSISVDGFYSQTANTCVTNSSEMAETYIQRTLIDELTGKIEAFAFKSLGKNLDAELIKEETRQDQVYGERLRYFQDIK